jgi:hypothetical protein
MNPRDFLLLSTGLVVAKRAAAAHFRTAISRAYYATSHPACRILDELGFPSTQGPQGHARVVRLLQRCGDDTLEAAGGLLRDLHADRIRADHELERTDVETRRAAQTAVELADSLFTDFDTIMADPARRAAATAMLKPLYSAITGKTLPERP